MAAPEKTIHHGGGFAEDGEVRVFRKQKELGQEWNCRSEFATTVATAVSHLRRSAFTLRFFPPLPRWA